MIYLNDKIHITTEQAVSILNKHTQDCGLFFNLDRVLDYVAFFTERKKYFNTVCSELSKTKNFDDLNRAGIFNVFVNTFHIPEDKLIQGKSKSLGKNVINDLLHSLNIDSKTKEFIKCYRAYTVAKYQISYFRQYVTLPLQVEEDKYGNRMVKASPIWNLLSTGRISGSNPSLQNILREALDIITEPKGIILVRADSGQIEPRITYSHYIKDPLIKALIILYNDAYFGLLHYILMSNEQERVARNDLTSISKVELPKERRDLLKKMCLSKNYGSSAVMGADPKLSALFDTKIKEHPLRLKLQEKIQEEVNNGTTSFRSFFGTEIIPKDTVKYKRGTNEFKEHLIRCGINNPIQGTASNLMCESIYESDKIVRNESKYLTRIAYSKHDELAFYISEDEDPALIEKLGDTVSYQVKDWIPIYCDKDIGVKESIDLTDSKLLYDPMLFQDEGME